jgi:hypothetical protein
LESGGSASTNEQADGLEALNDLLDLWSTQGWIVPYRTRDADMAVGSAAHSYSIGSGGDFNTTRPTQIDSLSITSDGVLRPIREGSQVEYNSNVVDATSLPSFFYYEPTFATGTLYFPTKLSTSMTVTIDSLKPFTSFSLIGTDINFPPGYVSALKASLAVSFAPEFEREAPASVIYAAEKGVEYIRSQSNIHRKKIAVTDRALRPRRAHYNVIADR